MITLYLFNPQAAQKLVFTKAVFKQKELDHLKAWIKKYEEENNCKLIRALLGKSELTVLHDGDELVLPAEPLAAKGFVFRMEQ